MYASRIATFASTRKLRATCCLARPYGYRLFGCFWGELLALLDFGIRCAHLRDMLTNCYHIIRKRMCLIAGR